GVFVAQNEPGALAPRHVGRDEEGGIRMTRVELAHLQPAAIAVEPPAEIAIERGDVEAMALHHRHCVGVDRHGRREPTAGSARGANPPAYREKRNFSATEPTRVLAVDFSLGGPAGAASLQTEKRKKDNRRPPTRAARPYSHPC